MGLTTTQPETLVVSVDEAKEQVQQYDIQEGAFLQRLIKVATFDLQNRTKRQFITATSVDVRDFFPWEDVIYLRLPPLVSVTSIVYVDSDGDDQTFSSSKYDVDTSNHAIGRVVLKESQSWPDTNTEANAVTITYTSGYGTASSDVPEPIRHAILLRVEDLYEGQQPRGGAFVGKNEQAIEALLSPYMLMEYA